MSSFGLLGWLEWGVSFAVGDTVWGTLARVFGLLAAVLFIVVFLVGILIKAHPSIL